jgi:hypothetical protein
VDPSISIRHHCMLPKLLNSIPILHFENEIYEEVD